MLDAPVQKEEALDKAEAPKLDSGMQAPSGNVKDVSPEIDPAPPKSKTIEVIATRDGYINGHRIPTGMRFKVSSMEKVGEWMKCVDPKLELEHQKIMKEKAQRRKLGDGPAYLR